nr:uncharacterized protein LOC126530507 isoform X1 [Dermacentor andersoni]
MRISAARAHIYSSPLYFARDVVYVAFGDPCAGLPAPKARTHTHSCPLQSHGPGQVSGGTATALLVPHHRHDRAHGAGHLPHRLLPAQPHLETEKGEDHRRPSRQQEQGCILVLSRKSVSDTHGSDKDSLHFSPFVQRRVFTTLLRP